jgi:uroporphyrinogen III methyltransferase/synthase
MALRSLLPPEDGGEGFDAICFASGKTAQHFLDTLGEICGRPRAEALLTQAAIISIGPVTTHALERLGLCVSQTATAPNIESMVEAVMRAMARK